MSTNSEQFLIKARKVHGNKYDYSMVVYINSRTKVIIICPIHGEFEQTPANHISGQGCIKCAGKIKLTLEDFIKKATIVHGDKYDYSRSDYTSVFNKLIIICRLHGEFEQTPANHFKGKGCPKCKSEKLSKDRYSNKEKFVEKAIKVHGNLYNYNNFTYIDAVTKGYVTCEKHGDYLVSPNNHLNGKGCYACGLIRRAKLKSSNTEEFIKKAKMVHGDKYDYSLVIYTNAHTKVTIICLKHGEFIQTPDSHLRGNGCPICNSSKGEFAIKAILDKHNIQYKQEYRVTEVGNLLYYDFYLPDYKLLIEFHGIQHYKYIPFFHRNGEDDLLIQKNRDDIVRSNARYFKYRYLEFNYKQLKLLSIIDFEKLFIDKLNFITREKENA